MKIGLSNDHAATDLKFVIEDCLESKGYEVINYGTDGYESYDYPVAGRMLGEAVMKGEVDCGFAICGTGIGISLAANKVRGIRAACVSEPVSARLAKEHNNAQIVCFGARIVGAELAKAIVDAYLEAEHLGGRHSRRVDMIMQIEEENR
jgi:ribose 5-phosphate isomerase B